MGWNDPARLSANGSGPCDAAAFVGSCAPAPSLAATEIASSPHVVQFFEQDAFLLESLLEYVRAGLDAGDACIVVAIPQRTEGIRSALSREGVDVAAAVQGGDLVLLDAASTLESISTGSAVDRGLFRQVIGELLSRAIESHPHVRVFGEMVGLLWERGDHAAAVALEEHWNELQSELGFALYCAYSSSIVSMPGAVARIDAICRSHSHVVPSESYSRLAGTGERLRSIAEWQHKAKVLEQEVARREAAEQNLSRLTRDLEEKVEDLHRLHELSSRLSGNLNLPAVMDEVLDGALAVHGTSMGLLSLCDGVADGLSLEAHRGFDEAFLREVRWVPSGGGSCGACFTHRRRVIVEDTEQDSLFAAYRGAARQAGFRSCHSTPLITRRGKIIGVLSVHFREPHRPSSRETQLMDLFSQMGADAIENAQLHLQARRELAERQLLLSREKEARAESEKASRLKDEFLATVSHELRTPLTAIIGWSHMLREDALDPATARRAVDTIERAATSQAQLIEDILDVSRLIAGKMRLSVAPVEPCAFVRAATSAVQLAADSKNIQLAVMTGPDAAANDRPLIGDASRLQQVVWNLVSNAVKFTPAGGRVEVRVDRSATDLQIQVSDTGEGIAADFLPYLFERFRQGDGSSTRRHHGLGLGLAIVRHVVELHGGTVRAESDGPGRGSTFTIRFPLAAATAKPEVRRLVSVGGSSRSFARPSALAGVRVLVVDNDPDTLGMLQVLLEEQRAVIQTAGSAAEAFEILRWYEPSVIVSDLAMPGEDGFSFIRRLRAREQRKGTQIPAVALTACVRVEDRRSALQAGFQMFVPKPIEPAELIATIVQLTGRSAAMPRKPPARATRPAARPI